MKRVLSLLLVALFVFLATGCNTKHMMSYHDQPFQYSEKAPTMKEVEAVIVKAATARGWLITKKSDGYMIGTLNVRNHTVKVDIKYTTKTFSITYNDSINMSYDPAKKTIHRRYNTWIMNLRNDIQDIIPITAE